MRFVFPVSAPVFAATERLAAPLTQARRLRILVVDDDPLLIKSLHDTLESDGHAVTVADGGQAGIDAFLAAEKRGQPFAVVITDLGMPYIDGRKVAATIRAAAPLTPIVLLTGWGQRLVAEDDVPPHVSRVLNKPPRLHELRSALAELTTPEAERTDWTSGDRHESDTAPRAARPFAASSNSGDASGSARVNVVPWPGPALSACSDPSKRPP
jgi:CheY-like chemotaxis protein